MQPPRHLLRQSECPGAASSERHQPRKHPEDWLWLFVLALLCTTLAYVLTLKSLKHLSAFASNLVINLEPVYGILLAIVILKEHKELNTMFYIGAGIILLTVFSYPLVQKINAKT